MVTARDVTATSGQQFALIIGEQDPFLAQLFQERLDLQALEFDERLPLTIW